MMDVNVGVFVEEDMTSDASLQVLANGIPPVQTLPQHSGL